MMATVFKFLLYTLDHLPCHSMLYNLCSQNSIVGPKLHLSRCPKGSPPSLNSVHANIATRHREVQLTSSLSDEESSSRNKDSDVLYVAWQATSYLPRGME